MSAQTVLIDIDSQEAFDAVIHVRNITPAHTAADLPDTEPAS
jgi:hypothetical protein